MPSPNYSAITPGVIFVAETGSGNGTPYTKVTWDAFAAAIYTYIQNHINGLDQSGNPGNMHSFLDVDARNGATALSEALAYANAANTLYSLDQRLSMILNVLRTFAGGSGTLTQRLTALAALPGSDLTTLGSASTADVLGTIPKRGATNGEINLRTLIMQQNGALPAGITGVQTFKRIAGQTAPFQYFQDESGGFLGQWGPFGGIIALSITLGGAAASTTPFGVTGATSQSVDVVSIKDISALPHLRVTKDYWVVARDGLYIGPVGSERQVIDNTGNFIAALLSPRQFNEFAVALSTTAMTGTVAAGKYVDANGAPNSFTGGTFPVNADPTRYVWWAITLGAANTLHATANTAGGNTVAGSAIKANFLPSEKKIGYVLVPPSATTLAAATFDDWRGTDGPDGNAGAAGGVATTTTMLTSADETAAYSSSQQLSKVLRGGASVAGPTGLGGTLTGPFVIASDYTSNADYGAALAPRLANDTSRDFEQQVSVSGATITVTGGANFPSWISTTFRWRQSITAQSVTASGGAGMRFVFADLSGATAGTYTLAMSLTNTPAANQKLIAAGWFDGTVFQGLLDVSSVRKLQATQYTPLRVFANATATALGAGMNAGLTGGPTLTIFAPAACLVDLDWSVNVISTAVSWTQFALTAQYGGAGGYATLQPYADCEWTAVTAQHFNVRGRYTGALQVGRNDFRVGGQVGSGTAGNPVPNATVIQGFVYGA